MKSHRLIAWLTLVAFLAAGCTTPKYQALPDFRDGGGKLGKIGIVTDVRVDYLSFDDADSRSKSAELSSQAAKIVEATAVRELAAMGYTPVVLAGGEDTRTLLDQYQKVRGEVQGPFHATRGRIDGLAPLPEAERVAKTAGVDEVAILTARDSVASNGIIMAAPVIAVGDVAYLLLSWHSLADFMAMPFRCELCNVDFAILDNAGKITFYRRDSLNGTDVESISRASARLARDLAAARQSPGIADSQ